MPEGNRLLPFLHKRKSFEHEQELRAIIYKLPLKNGAVDDSVEVFEDGKYIPVNLDALIQKFYVSPAVPQWFAETVKSIVKKYELNVDVVHSKLADSPVF